MDDYSKKAPTWLFKGKAKKLFISQLEVDQAWRDGWHGPMVTKTQAPVLDPVQTDPELGEPVSKPRRKRKYTRRKKAK